MSGYYNLTLTTSNLDTEGRLLVQIHDVDLALPTRNDYIVVNENTYDSMFAVSGTDVFQVDIRQFNDVTITGDGDTNPFSV